MNKYLQKIANSPKLMAAKIIGGTIGAVGATAGSRH